jgi:hypothetical protein
MAGMAHGRASWLTQASDRNGSVDFNVSGHPVLASRRQGSTVLRDPAVGQSFRDFMVRNGD